MNENPKLKDMAKEFIENQEKLKKLYREKMRNKSRPPETDAVIRQK